MDTKSILITYLKFISPIVVLLALKEEIFHKKSSLNTAIKDMVLGPGENAEIYLAHRGGSIDQGGNEYYSSLKIPVYQGEEGKNLELKPFMINHITKYQAAVFDQLVDEWPALKQWDINTQEGFDYMQKAFGEDYLISTLVVDSYLYATHRHSAERDIDTFSDLMAKVNKKNQQTKYVPKGGKIEGARISMLLNEEIPPSIKQDIQEPRVTEQLLDLKSVSMSILKQKSVSAARAESHEQLICGVAGLTNVHLVTGWQRYIMYAGDFFDGKEPMPSNVSPIDMTRGLQSTRVHQISLEKGDCVFIPSHWWYQIEVPDVETSDNSLLVTYAYEESSTWVDMVMHGVNNHIL